MKGTFIWLNYAVISIRHRLAACEFSRGRFDVWPCVLDNDTFRNISVHSFHLVRRWTSQTEVELDKDWDYF